MLNVIFLVFLDVILVPELFKKLRETPWNNFHQVSPKSEPGCPSNLMLSHSYIEKNFQYFLCFWLLFWSLTCLESCGRLLGTISTKSRPNPIPGVRVISCYLMLRPQTVYIGICVKTQTPFKIIVWRTLLTGGFVNRGFYWQGGFLTEGY